MKHVSRRLNQSYAEVLASLGDAKNVYGALEETTRILLQNLERRIEWKIQDAAARNQRQPVSLTSEVAEMERIGRIHAGLQDPRLIEYRSGDPDQGGREICRIIELARKEFGSGKTINNPEAKAEEAPEGVKEMEDGEGDKTLQNPTVERPPAVSNLCLSHGKIRRGSG